MNMVQMVNRYLRQQGRTERLRKGAGYYYWSNLHWPSVMVYRASDMTFNQWQAETDSNIKNLPAEPAGAVQIPSTKPNWTRGRYGVMVGSELHGYFRTFTGAFNWRVYLAATLKAGTELRILDKGSVCNVHIAGSTT